MTTTTDTTERQPDPMTDTLELADRTLDALSGGQRQRVWIALTLAQGTDLILLDEPTTYLDLAHSIDVLDLVRRLRDDHGKTVVMVLHDLNLAARYSDSLVVMKNGAIVTTGAPGWRLHSSSSAARAGAIGLASSPFQPYTSYRTWWTRTDRP